MVSPVSILLLLAVFAVGAGLLGYGTLGVLDLLRLSRGSTSAAAIDAGLLSIAGTAVHSENHGTVTSPVTGAEALWYAYEIQHRASDLARPDWETVAEDAGGRPFGLETADGRVTLDPAGARVAVDPDLDAEVEADPAELDASTADAAVSEAGSMTVGGVDLTAGEYYRLIERRITLGDDLQVSGAATVDRPEPSGDAAATSTISAAAPHGRLRRLLAVPLVIDQPGGAGALGVLRDRILVGLVFGLPLTMLAVVYAYLAVN
jgi:hypothetical protein